MCAFVCTSGKASISKPEFIKVFFHVFRIFSNESGLTLVGHFHSMLSVYYE